MHLQYFGRKRGPPPSPESLQRWAVVELHALCLPPLDFKLIVIIVLDRVIDKYAVTQRQDSETRSYSINYRNDNLQL